jgi:DNA-directed RNA polymerase sigma subunit (sigma70/sigma32)
MPHKTSERIDLGISIAHALNPGKQLSCGEIAAYADCSRTRIAEIERKALAKVRRLLRLRGISGDFAEALRGM